MADSSTRLSLLGRLRLTPTDQEAWGEFVERYGRQVYAWCRQWGLQEADAEDVTQNVLADLARQMRTFEYHPSGRFRSWLRTIAHRAWCDLLDSRRPRPPAAATAPCSASSTPWKPARTCSNTWIRSAGASCCRPR